MNNKSVTENMGAKDPTINNNAWSFETCAGAEPIERASPPVWPAECAGICHMLNQCLVDCIDLRLQCKQAQWDMSGASLNGLAFVCGQSAADLEIYADRLASRISALGGIADGRLDTIVERSGVNANSSPGAHVRDFRHVDEIASSLAVAACSLRSDSAAMAAECDRQTSELLQEVAAGLESHRTDMEAQQ